MADHAIHGRVVARRYHGKTLSFCTLLVRHEAPNGLDLTAYSDKSRIHDDQGLPVPVCFDAVHLAAPEDPWLPFPAGKRDIGHGDEIHVVVHPTTNKHGRPQLLVTHWRLPSLQSSGTVRRHIVPNKDSPLDASAQDVIAEQRQQLESRLAKAAVILHHFVSLPKHRLHPLPARLAWATAALPGAAIVFCCGILSHQERISLPTAVMILSTSLTLLATQRAWSPKVLSRLPPLPEATISMPNDVCRLFATVPSGFQDVAAGELIEKVQATDIELLDGKVVFSVPRSAMSSLRHLRSIEKLYVLLLKASDLLASPHVLGQLEYDVPAVLPGELVEQALATWQAFHDHPTRPSTFRVTLRLGGVSPVAQMDASQALAAGFASRFCLVPELKAFDVEVFAHVQYPPPYTTGNMLLGLALLRRTMAFDEFGAHVGHGVSATGRQMSTTTLRPTIAYNLLRLAHPERSAVLVDPMCGCGTIPEMAAKHFAGQLFCLAGDYADAAVARAAHNAALATAANPNVLLDVVQWDCRRLPVRRDFVDALVTDMPFGKRIGSHAKNNQSYPEILHEFCRITAKGSGTAVLLTTERELMAKQLTRYKTWLGHRNGTVNVGGLDAKCFQLSYL
ncbi:THUMP domain-containing protein 3 [Achlya hypogyna]|uniref:THUMP domain-containing protein 3 n=1 Tax=Achlya hypogyna TaxID=1202772 RepID=A0A1V9Z691_ACHHY|nr:THUMP domain-containing protein 3 [Achlya hypogyna]